MAWQPPPRPGQNPASPATPPPAAAKEAPSLKDLNYYELLQVDRDAHPTIIRYAYRFLAAMYHPDNGETGNADKFRIVSEAWKTLSDEGKRVAYDMSLGAKEQSNTASAPSSQQTHAKASDFGRGSLPDMPKTGIAWNEVELQLAILQILLTARRANPKAGGASGKMMLDVLNIDNISQIEFALWYLRENGLIEMGERVFMITAKGLDYLTEKLSRTQILGGTSAVEEKTNSAISKSGLPANISR
jgi:curved DNA-binding protein